MGSSALEALFNKLPDKVVSSSMLTSSSLSIRSLTGFTVIVNVEVSTSPAPSSTI